LDIGSFRSSHAGVFKTLKATTNLWQYSRKVFIKEIPTEKLQTNSNPAKIF
jgi:hypothetical protein